VLASFASAPACHAGVAYVQTNLTSDGTDVAGAAHIDANLKNPWGMVILPDGTFRVSDQLIGKSSQYDRTGATAGPVINVPFAAPAVFSAPTGLVVNGTSDFKIGPAGSQQPAQLLFANINGTISGFNSSVDAANAVTATTVSGAAYTGLARSTAGGANRLFAANAGQNRIDVFDPSFGIVPQAPGAFTDPDTPSGLNVFNVAAVDDLLVVTYSIPGQEAREEKEGSGSVSIYDTSGKLVKHLASGGRLASPWGVAKAPAGFGDLGGALLIGNFNEEGHINAFNPTTGQLLDTLADSKGHELENDELWSLTFGNGAGGTSTDALYITAGVGDETGGRFAVITVNGGGGGGGGGTVVPLPNLIAETALLLGAAAFIQHRWRVVRAR